MHRSVQILISVFALFFLTNCKKDIEDPAKEPYTTGNIQFLYYNYVGKPVINLTVPTIANIYSADKKVLYIEREESFLRSGTPVKDRITIIMSNLDLDKIHLPYIFTTNDPAYAGFLYDQIYETNTLREGGSAPGTMTLTIISKKDDRIQGIFSGELYGSGAPTYIRDGKFDIKIVRE